MKLKARYIIEGIIQKCVICRIHKKGRFLIIDLPNKKYIAICEKCL